MQYRNRIKTQILDANEQGSSQIAAECVRAGGLIAVNFNGAFALLGDAAQLNSAETIFKIKQRPREKTLAFVCAPEACAQFVAHEQLHWPFAQIVALQQAAHALGVILPANRQTTPTHMLVGETILNVWSEYAPLRHLFEAFQALGGHTFHGSSANMSCQPTLVTVDAVLATFGGKLDAIYAALDFVMLDDRRRSTSLLDLTQPEPILRRSGNVPVEELQPLAEAAGFGRILVAPNVKYV